VQLRGPLLHENCSSGDKGANHAVGIGCSNGSDLWCPHPFCCSRDSPGAPPPPRGPSGRARKKMRLARLQSVVCPPSRAHFSFEVQSPTSCMSCTSVVISALAKTFYHISFALWLCVSWPPMESKKATQHAHASFMEVIFVKVGFQTYHIDILI